MPKIPDKCPACGGQLVITRLSCSICETEVTGQYEGTIFDRLSGENLRFVELYLGMRGNIKEMERETGLSYWTIRGQLNDIIEELGLEARAKTRLKQRKAQRDILESLERGELSIEEAEAKLAALKKQASG